MDINDEKIVSITKSNTTVYTVMISISDDIGSVLSDSYS